MKLSINDALTQGMVAHKSGKTQEAERIYRSILQVHPKHPDANHNMGVLAVSAGEIETAIPLFKIALEANPKIDQFWLSLIDALIKGKRFKDADDFFKKALEPGMNKRQLEKIAGPLTSISNRRTKAPESYVKIIKNQPFYAGIPAPIRLENYDQ